MVQEINKKEPERSSVWHLSRIVFQTRRNHSQPCRYATFFSFFFSPFLAPGDQNALRQHDVFGARGETRTKNFGSSYHYLPTYTYDTRATLEQKSWTLLEKTISEITSSVGKHSSHGYLLYSLPSGMPKYPLLRIISQMQIFYLSSPNSINTVFELLRKTYLGKSTKHISCIIPKCFFFSK